MIGPNRVAGRQHALAQVPTTAGTGIRGRHPRAGHRSRQGTEIAVESPYLMADMAVLDPDLTFTVPPAVTAATGIDAMAHCVEAFTNRNAHPMIDSYARMGIDLVGEILARAPSPTAATPRRARG